MGLIQSNRSSLMSLINTEVKPFKCEAFKDGEFITVTEKSFKGRWSVLVFYPADFTFVCPTELEDLADNLPEFNAIDCQVFCASTDTHYAHMAWHENSPAIRKVKYTMIGDPTGALTRNFQVMIEEAGLALRGTFLIDPNGIIKAMEVQDTSIGRDAESLLRKVKAAQYVAQNSGEVCPAKWRSGDKTIKPTIDLVGKI
jgi:NADH-dependent peroxiredoxin subunit C